MYNLLRQLIKSLKVSKHEVLTASDNASIAPSEVQFLKDNSHMLIKLP